MKEGWKTVKLGEVCTFNKEQGMFSSLKYVGMEHIESGTGIVVGGLNSTEIKSNTFKFYRGDVLYGRLRPYLKKVFVAEHEGCCSTEIFPIKTTLNPYFLKYWFLSEEVTIKINKTCGGCRMPRANMNEVLTFYISFPPLEEQQRIVSILDASFEKIDALKKNAKENLKNAKALFQQVLAQELKPKEGWVEKKLGEICEITSSKRIFKNEYTENGIPFYRTKELKELAHGRNISLELFISESRYNDIKAKFGVPQIGDILISAVGTIGETLIIDNVNPFYFKDGNIVWLRKINGVNSNFLKISIDSIVEKLKSITRGAAYNALTIEKLKEMQITYPILEEEQIKILSTIQTLSEKCRRLEQVAQQTIRECDALKQSILRQAFSGEL